MEMTKVQPLVIRDTEKNTPKYTLEFNRESVVWAERRGFKVAEVADYPVTGVSDLFFYAFRMHHKGITHDMTDAILNDIGGWNTEGLIKRLMALYDAGMESLNAAGGEEKNAKYALEF